MKIGGIKPIALLVLGYCIETARKESMPEIWTNLKEVEATLNRYISMKALPLNLSPGHISASFLMLEGGYISIERDSQEQGRNLERPFKVRVNPSGKAYYERLKEEIGYEPSGITG